MASEDSDQFMPGLAMVHSLCEPRDFDETFRREMPTLSAYLKRGDELVEVASLRGLQRMTLEERDNHLEEVVPSLHAIAVEVLLVVVVAAVDTHRADSKELPQLVEGAHAARALHDGEAMGDLIPGFVALAAHAVWLPHEPDGEAAFSVHKTDNPASPDQSFLLVFRTDQIVTAHDHKSRASTGQILGFSSI
jgi:hypothetical protein